jgi:hypothetical protein
VSPIPGEAPAGPIDQEDPFEEEVPEDPTDDEEELVIEWLGAGETQMHETVRSQVSEDLDLFRSQAD